jgi:hypothetical protein
MIRRKNWPLLAFLPAAIPSMLLLGIMLKRMPARSPFMTSRTRVYREEMEFLEGHEPVCRSPSFDGECLT